MPSRTHSSNSNRIDAKETAVVVAETEKEEIVGGTSLRFSTDSSSSTQQPQQHLDQKIKNEHVRSDPPTHHDIVKQYRRGLTAVVDRCVYISYNRYRSVPKSLFVAVLVETRAC